ncbi:MAG: MerR family transcriptional regulator [Vampirovibrionales bacterium]
MTSSTIQDTLAKYDIHPQQLRDWEEALGMSIPTDSQGNKLYTRQHLNLFKNIKKHIALGRSLAHIKQIISLPPAQESQPVERNVKQAWGHAPSLQKVKTPVAQVAATTVTNPLPLHADAVLPLSLESEALLESFKESAETVMHPVEATLLSEPIDSPETPNRLDLEATLQAELRADVQNEFPEITSDPFEVSPDADVSSPEIIVEAHASIQALEDVLSEPISIEATPAQEPVVSVEEAPIQSPNQSDTVIHASLADAIKSSPSPQHVSEWSFTPAIMSPQALVESIKANAVNATPVFETVEAPVMPKQNSIVEKRSTEASPTQYLSAPLAVLHEKQEHFLQIVDRLLTEKDALQTRLVEAEKLNSHLYNVNNLFNKKVKELTTLIKKMKHTYNENDLMKLMDDKAKLQRQLLDAEKDKLDAQRQAERAKDDQKYAQAAQKYLADELKSQRQGFAGSRFLGDWRESLKLREIQYDTFGLNVEEERSQHRLIDSVPTRIVGNVAFVTTRYAYPDNTLWQRLETLTIVYMEENKAQGELQVDYILDGIPVCRAIYTANLERIS